MKDTEAWKLGQDSYSKMIVWFKDGNVRTFYSLDWKHKVSKTRDKTIGIERFHKLIKKYGALAGTIDIYEKETGQLISRFYEGIEKPIHDTNGIS